MLVAGVTWEGRCSGPPLLGAAVSLDSCSSAEPNGKGNAWERRREAKRRVSEPFPCVDHGSPKAEPIITAQDQFCSCQHLP